MVISESEIRRLIAESLMVESAAVCKSGSQPVKILWQGKEKSVYPDFSNPFTRKVDGRHTAFIELHHWEDGRCRPFAQIQKDKIQYVKKSRPPAGSGIPRSSWDRLSESQKRKIEKDIRDGAKVALTDIKSIDPDIEKDPEWNGYDWANFAGALVLGFDVRRLYNAIQTGDSNLIASELGTAAFSAIASRLFPVWAIVKIFKSQRLRGWIKSIIEKFSGKSGGKASREAGEVKKTLDKEVNKKVRASRDDSRVRNTMNKPPPEYFKWWNSIGRTVFVGRSPDAGDVRAYYMRHIKQKTSEKSRLKPKVGSGLIGRKLRSPSSKARRFAPKYPHTLGEIISDKVYNFGGGYDVVLVRMNNNRTAAFYRSSGQGAAKAGREAGYGPGDWVPMTGLNHSVVNPGRGISPVHDHYYKNWVVKDIFQSGKEKFPADTDIEKWVGKSLKALDNDRMLSGHGGIAPTHRLRTLGNPDAGWVKTLDSKYIGPERWKEMAELNKWLDDHGVRIRKRIQDGNLNIPGVTQTWDDYVKWMTARGLGSQVK